LRPDEFEFAERCLEQLARIMALELHTEYASAPGAGAAGGLGFGLRCFADAQLEPGFALFASYANLAERLRQAQLVLTGEGAIDDSTIMGKGVGELARLCKASGVQCLGLGGMVADPARAKELFTNTYALTRIWPRRKRPWAAPLSGSKNSPPRPRGNGWSNKASRAAMAICVYPRHLRVNSFEILTRLRTPLREIFPGCSFPPAGLPPGARDGG